MRRRELIAGLAVLASAGCSVTGGAKTPTMGDAQKWASSIVAALSQLGGGLIANGSLSGKSAATVQASISSAQAAVAAFTSLEPGATSAQAIAEEILSIVQALAPLLPLDPGVRSAVQLGISVLYAFVQDIPMAVPGVPATLQMVAVRHDRCTPACD